MRKYKLSDKQLEIIRGALEKLYYSCKDEGEREEMAEITKLEESLIKQEKEHDVTDKEMTSTISMCFQELFNSKPTIEKMQKIIDNLPEDLKADAEQFGWDDTEVRDRAYGWIEDEFDGDDEL